MIDWLNNLSDAQQFALFTGVKILAAFAILMTMAILTRLKMTKFQFILDFHRHAGVAEAGPR